MREIPPVIIYTHIVEAASLQTILDCAENVRIALTRLLDAAGISGPRVRHLTETLGIDKSVASRLARGLRAQSLTELLRELPAAEGLGRIVAACDQQGAPPDTVAAARQAIGALETAVRSLPGGRAGLATALAGSTDEAAAGGASRARAERAARRSAFNASCFLQGVWVEAAVHGLIIGPGSTRDRLHQAMVNGAIGVRRLRPGPPITVGGVYGSPLNAGPPMRTTLAGEAIGDDPSRALLTEFCAGDMDRLQVDRAGSTYLLWLGRNDPQLDHPTSVVYGVKNLDFVERFRSDRYHYACTNYTVRRPTRLLLIEVLIWQGAFGPRGPELRLSMDPMRTPDPIGGPPADDREMMEHAVGYAPMGRGFDRRGSRRADEYVPIFRRAMQQLGWNPADFARYRLEIEYPLGFVGIQTWFALADRPG